MRRREFSKLMLAASAATALPGCLGSTRTSVAAKGHRVFVVAFDGLEPEIVKKLIASGRMPNLARLAQSGGLTKMATSTPPHTPVAFSNIISGADPGVHHVFDFIQRDPNPTEPELPVRPYFGSAEAVTPENQWAIPLGKWHLPLVGGHTRLLRRGPAFWDALIANGIDAEIYYLPSNYPPSPPEGPGRFRCVSGMGTPDLLGDYGTFTLFTPDAPLEGRQVGGGRFAFLSMVRNYAQADLIGPPNYLRSSSSTISAPPLRAVLDIARDPYAPVARISIDGQHILLNEGEWSHFVPVVFRTGIPGSPVLGAMGAPVSIQGMVRLFMKQVHPKFELYVSPINIDPMSPVNQISVPAGLASQLAARHGRFYTAGIPEDTKALSNGALDEDQFLSQSELAMQERIAQYREALSQFTQGCLFYYFGATDLVQHMFWRDRDERHPGRKAEQGDRFAAVIEDTYHEIDELVGDAAQAAGPTDTIIVLSDHGFNSFRRGFNLNSWLVDQNFIRLGDSERRALDPLFPGVDWRQTRAYGLGMNGLYLNAAGREKYGIVKEPQWRSLLEEIRDKLMAVLDDDGEPVIRQVDLAEDIYPGADRNVAPDLFVGYAAGYRASWDTVLGTMPLNLLVDNLDRWSGDHCIHPDVVPGVLVANRKVTVESPDIRDIAPTILNEFGIAPMPHMTGKPLFGNQL